MLEKIDYITEKLCEYDINNCKEIKKKSDNYKEKIKKTYGILREKIAVFKNKNIVQYHPAWNYFAKDFGFKIIGTLSKEHGANISFKKYIYLLKESEKNHVKYVITGFKTKNNMLKNFSGSINGKILYLDLFGNPSLSYIDLLKKDINIFLSENSL